MDTFAFKVCSKCKIEKSLGEFYKDKTQAGGLEYRCKVCSRAKVSSHNNKNKNTYIGPVEFKICKICKLEKPGSEFQMNKCSKDGLQRKCKNCRSTSTEEKEYEKRYNKSEARRESLKKYRLKESSRIKVNDRSRWQYDNNIEYRIKAMLRSRLYKAVNRDQKAGSAVKDLGCSVLEFKNYIESKWLPGMTWDNWAQHGWHLDHIVPLASFDLTNGEQFSQAVHYTNLQPLWAPDNWSKHASEDI